MQAVNVGKKKVVIVGSGMMVPSLLANLEKDYEVLIASNMEEEAKKLAAPYKTVSFKECNVTNLAEMTDLV